MVICQLKMLCTMYSFRGDIKSCVYKTEKTLPWGFAGIDASLIFLLFLMFMASGSLTVNLFSDTIVKVVLVGFFPWTDALSLVWDGQSFFTGGSE